MTDPPTVHAAIARTLKELGVEALFGLIGDANLFMVDSWVRAQGGRYVAATHEANAVLMALGHAAATGGVGAATITQGPALSNAMTALIDGVKGGLPMVLLAGDTPRDDPHHPQAVNQRALVEAAGAGWERLRGPRTVVQDVATAFRRARAERRPIVLDMQVEMMWEAAIRADLPPAPPPGAARPAEGPALDAAVGIIAAARRPLVLAGRGAIHAREALVRLADRIEAPLATTLKAKGLFAGHPYDLGVFGTLATPAASEVIGAADLILAFGAGLNRFTTAKGAYVEKRRLIQVETDPALIGATAQPDAALVADAAETAEALIGWLDAAEIPGSAATAELAAGALAAPPPLPPARNAPGTVDISRALARLDAALPPDRLFVTDGGRFLNEGWTRISVSAAENMILSVNTGAIGLGTGYLVGAAVARPGQTVLFVTGDGGFMMGGLAEFSTLVRERLDVVFVVCNDGGYGAEYVQFEDRQMDPGLSLFDWPSFAGLARAMGAEARRVTSGEELEEAMAALGRRGAGPFLLELVLDPACVPRLSL